LPELGSSEARPFGFEAVGETRIRDVLGQLVSCTDWTAVVNICCMAWLMPVDGVTWKWKPGVAQAFSAWPIWLPAGSLILLGLTGELLYGPIH